MQLHPARSPENRSTKRNTSGSEALFGGLAPEYFLFHFTPCNIRSAGLLLYVDDGGEHLPGYLQLPLKPRDLLNRISGRLA